MSKVDFILTRMLLSELAPGDLFVDETPTQFKAASLIPNGIGHRVWIRGNDKIAKRDDHEITLVEIIPALDRNDQ